MTTPVRYAYLSINQRRPWEPYLNATITSMLIASTNGSKWMPHVRCAAIHQRVPLEPLFLPGHLLIHRQDYHHRTKFLVVKGVYNIWSLSLCTMERYFCVIEFYCGIHREKIKEKKSWNKEIYRLVLAIHYCFDIGPNPPCSKLTDFSFLNAINDYYIEAIPTLSLRIRLIYHMVSSKSNK